MYCVQQFFSNPSGVCFVFLQRQDKSNVFKENTQTRTIYAVYMLNPPHVVFISGVNIININPKSNNNNEHSIPGLIQANLCKIQGLFNGFFKCHPWFSRTTSL